MRVDHLQLDTLRLRLLKVGGRVYQWRDRVRLRLASSHPGRPRWDHLAAYHRLRESSGLAACTVLFLTVRRFSIWLS
jgi:hypothetical protein